MADKLHPLAFSLRQATQADAATIRGIIHETGINPMGLDWRRFTLAVEGGEKIIGCGQIKPHADGSFELASIAVLPEWRGRGVARAIIARLLEGYPGRLYLTCRSTLEPLYNKFGFQTVSLAEMPPYFRRISRLVNFLNRLAHQTVTLLVMMRN